MFVSKKSHSVLLAVAVLSCAILSPKTALAVNECATGTVLAHEGKCNEEDDSSECTTRMEQTPQAYWCCCTDLGGVGEGKDTGCAAYGSSHGPSDLSYPVAICFVLVSFALHRLRQRTAGSSRRSQR